MSNRSKSLPAIPSSLQESKSIYLTPSSNATSNGGYRSNTPPTLRRHTSDPSRCSISARVPLSDELTFPALLRRSNKSNIKNGRNSVQHDNPQDSSRRRTVANTQVPKVKLLPKRSSNWRDEKLYWTNIRGMNQTDAILYHRFFSWIKGILNDTSFSCYRCSFYSITARSSIEYPPFPPLEFIMYHKLYQVYAFIEHCKQ